MTELETLTARVMACSTLDDAMDIVCAAWLMCDSDNIPAWVKTLGDAPIHYADHAVKAAQAKLAELAQG
jgi:hypothetical protein